MMSLKIIVRNLMILFLASLFVVSHKNLDVIAKLNQEFESGTLDLTFQDQVVGNLVYRSVYNEVTAVTTLEPDYGGIAPFHPYFAQSLLINESSYFFSNTITGFEIYNDNNGNGFIDSHEEIVYLVMTTLLIIIFHHLTSKTTVIVMDWKIKLLNYWKKTKTNLSHYILLL